MLLAAALFLRAVVPVGWMPDTASEVLEVRICNSDATMHIPLKADGDSEPKGGDQPSMTCLFAGLGGAADLPPAVIPTALLLPPAQVGIAVLAPLLLRRTAYFLPPGRAPPVRA